jgi:hypothetical protein
MFLRNLVFTCLLLVSSLGAAYAQPFGPAKETGFPFTIVPLTIDEGSSLEVVLTEKTRFKMDEPVHGRLIEPVYAFDREVIPSGTEVLGKVTGFRGGGTWKRISSWISGDFTPVRDPEITFDTLILANGSRLAIATSAVYGTNLLVRSGSAVPATNALIAANKPPAKDFFKGLLWNASPYRPQSLPPGTHYRATLLKPLEFGPAIVGTAALDAIGSQPPRASVLYARLMTPMDSRTTKPGTVIEALLTRPLFSMDNLLIFPAGARIQGEVVQVRAARRLHHSGELAFKFTKIEPPNSLLWVKWEAQKIDGRLAGVEVTDNLAHLRIGNDGATRIVETKDRFFAPAFGLLMSGIGGVRNFGATSEPFSQAFTGAYSSSLIKRVAGGGAGFGLPGGIAGRMIPPVGMGLWLFSIGESVFTNFLARGQEIQLPVNTSVEIHLQSE